MVHTHTMDDGFLQGVLEAEGCFSVTITHNDTYQHGINPRFLAYIGTDDRDRELVDMIQEYLGIGHTRVAPDTYRWRVRTLGGCRELVDYIEDNALPEFRTTSKYACYERWRDLLRDRDELLESKDGAVELVRRACDINPQHASNRTPPEETIQVIRSS